MPIVKPQKPKPISKRQIKACEVILSSVRRHWKATQDKADYIFISEELWQELDDIPINANIIVNPHLKGIACYVRRRGKDQPD